MFAYTLSSLHIKLYPISLNNHLLAIDDVKTIGWGIDALTIKIIHNNLIVGLK